MNHSTRIVIFFCIVLIVFSLFAGCIKIGISEDTKVDKDGNIDHAKISYTTDKAGYGLLKTQAKSAGFTTVKDLFTKNISKSLGSDIAYTETWNSDKSSVTISLERFGPFTPTSDSKMSIQNIDGNLVYKDDTYYNPSATGSSSTKTTSGLSAAQTKKLADMMLSGITLDYSVEMPGNIIDSNADTVTDNKAEWHAAGADVFNTKIYAKSEVPLLPGFEALIAVVGLITVCLVRKKRV